MPVLIALLVLVGSIVALRWFLRANPSKLAGSARRILMGLAVLGAGLVLLFSIRFVPELLPELAGLLGVVIIGGLTRWLRQYLAGGSRGFSTPGGAQRTEVRTAFLRAWIDHGTSDVGGAVIAGRLAGRTLDGLSEVELRGLLAECAGDPDSVRVLEAYLDRRLGTEWRQARQEPPRPARGDMSREEALSILGLKEGATADDIRAAHRRLIQRVHPDVGGTADLAARINRAKDVLLGV
ncbi:MAG: molecular chaperone DnaJ [Alphaproteobacteria bacterium]|nr:molecular chaperone DnaJ [Alphaproteobacteria bacterium]